MSLYSAAIPVVLASTSPRRRQLLALMGVPFEAIASDVDETVRPDEVPGELAKRLSLAKAKAVASIRRDVVVIAADTLVTLDGEVLGKPDSASVAFEMLARLRGREHIVYSGLSVIDVPRGRHCTQVVATSVRMRDYADDEIRRYVATGDPMDKAGAYAIQDATLDPVAWLDGCYANVMGLPMCHLYRVLQTYPVCGLVHPLRCCPLAIGSGCRWASDITVMPLGAEWLRADLDDV